VTGQPTHPDTEVLAEFCAGLVTGRRAATITAHLAGCARCTGLADELAGVSALLAAVPAPAMPDPVTHRLDTVLAAEVAHRADSERARGNPQRDPATRRRRARSGGFRRISLRMLAPAAAVVLVAAGGYALSRHGSTPQMQGASAGPAVSAASGPPGVAGPKAAAGTAAAGTALQPQRESPADFITIVISPVNFQPGRTLTQQLEADLRVPVTARTTHAVPASVRTCVHRVAGSAAVLRVESAHLAGQPVTVVVTRTGQADDEVQLVGPGCSATSSHVLATRTVPPGISEP
jgi:hypothetical protein